LVFVINFLSIKRFFIEQKYDESINTNIICITEIINGKIHVCHDQSKKLTYEFCSSSVSGIHLNEFPEQQHIIEQWQFVYSYYH